MRKQPETNFKEKVLPLIRAIPNTWAVKVQMVSIVGVPDVIGVVNGHFFALELKKNKAEAEKKTGRVVKQAHELFKIRDAGGYGEFCYPENWEEIYKDLCALSL